MRNSLLMTIPLFSVLAAGVHCNWSLTDSLSNSSSSNLVILNNLGEEDQHEE
jgi:hypothetical protein